MVTLTLDGDIEKRLEQLGAGTPAAKAALARKALLEALEEELEGAAAWARLADERKASAGAERVWTLEQLERGDDLAD